MISLLVDEVTKFNKVSWDLINQHDSIVDKRVILIKFADRLSNTCLLFKYMEHEKWKVKAKETIDIFSPLLLALALQKLR